MSMILVSRISHLPVNVNVWFANTIEMTIDIWFCLERQPLFSFSIHLMHMDHIYTSGLFSRSYYYHVLRAICSTASSASFKCSRPPSNLVNGQELTICDIVWVSPQSHSSLSVKPHFLWHALQWPWPVRKWFSSNHWHLWRSKPGSQIVGSTAKVELTTVADCQSSLHRLVKSIDCMSLHSGLHDSCRSDNIGL